MSTRDLITAADPARRVAQSDLGLDVDAVLRDLAAQPRPVPGQGGLRSTPPRRHRLDFALAAAVTAVIAAVAFIPGTRTHTPAGRSTGAPTSASSTASAEALARAEALLDGITTPAEAKRVSTPPVQYLAKQWTGLACKGTESARPRYWVVPGTTLHDVAQYLDAHRPASATRLPFNHDTGSGTSGAFTLYRPTAHSEVVIAIATDGTGVGIRADADVAPGSTCLASGS